MEVLAFDFVLFSICSNLIWVILYTHLLKYCTWEEIFITLLLPLLCCFTSGLVLQETLASYFILFAFSGSQIQFALFCTGEKIYNTVTLFYTLILITIYNTSFTPTIYNSKMLLASVIIMQWYNLWGYNTQRGLSFFSTFSTFLLTIISYVYFFVVFPFWLRLMMWILSPPVMQMLLYFFLFYLI